MLVLRVKIDIMQLEGYLWSTGCLGLSGKETCDERDLQHLVDDKGRVFAHNEAEFDVYNLLFGLVCFGAPVLGGGVAAIVRIYKSLDEARREKLWPIFFCCSAILFLTIILYLIISVLVLGYSFDIVGNAFHVLSIIQDDSVAAEVCSPLPVYTALVTSTVLLGGLGLAVSVPFIGGCLFFIVYQSIRCIQVVYCRLTT